ncbi:hypothetical protein SMALB_2948 [Streptomyces malaysiensis]|uniref:Uncharacterized protein n=1 Tax=Streptomyces malaysiensis TaxID=92644 RepID=A0A7X6AX77_STRMQ|nr:hypothetical protein [Streptomyces malaysiensis]
MPGSRFRRRAAGGGWQGRWRLPYSGACADAGPPRGGVPLRKTFDKLVASGQAFSEGVPGGAVSPAGPRPKTAEAAAGAHHHRPVSRRRGPSPPPPSPMLNGAEGARRNPHRTTGPSTGTRSRRSHTPRQMVEITPLEPPDKGGPWGWLRGDDGRRGIAFADEYEVGRRG